MLVDHVRELERRRKRNLQLLPWLIGFFAILTGLALVGRFF